MPSHHQTCPECGHLNPTNSLQCEQCNADLLTMIANSDDARPTTKPIDEHDIDEPIQTMHIDDILDEDERLKTGKAVMRGDLLLTEQSSGKVFRIRNDHLQEVVIGRRNPDTGYIPSVDLSEVDGHKYGVSRRHATLTRRDSLIVLIDHNSVNGTFLNGKRLMPEQPRVVRDSDMIRLGKLELMITFDTGE